MYKEAKFWDKIAKKYARQPIGDDEAYQKKLEKTREYLTSETEVFELGCGTGSTALLHAPYVKHIHATDISSAMIAIAQGKAKDQGVGNVTFETVALDDVQVADGSKDVVLGHSIFHLLKNREEALAHIYRMLKPGGVLISSTPCVGETMGYLKFISPLARWLGFFPFLRFFNIEDLKKNIANTGFNVEYEWRVGKTMVLFVVARKPG